MKRIFLIGVLLVASFCFSGCTTYQRFKAYGLELEAASNAVVLEPAHIMVSFYLDAAKTRELYFPLRYQREIKKSLKPNAYQPLAIFVGRKTISIEIIQCKIILNDGKEDRILNLSGEDFDYRSLSEAPYFTVKSDIYIEDKWETIEEAEFIFEFYEIGDKYKKHYTAKKVFKPKFEVLFTNLSMSG
jgi:hypothetical protein